MVNVMSKEGYLLHPTTRYGVVRRMLRDGRAVVAENKPFTIQLTYSVPEDQRYPILKQPTQAEA